MVVAVAMATVVAACSGGPSRPAGAPVGGAAAKAVATPPPRVFTIAASGDFLGHGPVVARAAATGRASGQAYDFGPMLTAIKPIVSDADLGICHLETPLSADNRNLSSYPVFNVPRELAAGIAASGFDGCSVASNHAFDKGAAGVSATLDVLDAAGLGHAGTARTPAEAATPNRREIEGVHVAHLSYSYGLNGFRLPSDQPWLVNLIDPPERILADARGAREAGARFVVVSLHWGNEYQVAPTDEQRAIARQLLESPEVDLVLGHHAHVVQPVEKIGEKYVVYGMGNFLSNQSPRCCPANSQDGVIVLVTVEAGAAAGGGAARVTRVSYQPTWVQPGSYKVLPVARALGDPATPPAERAELTRSWQRTVDAISSLGADGAGVQPAEVPPARP